MREEKRAEGESEEASAGDAARDREGGRQSARE
jgi:hypothetical protein